MNKDFPTSLDNSKLLVFCVGLLLTSCFGYACQRTDLAEARNTTPRAMPADRAQSIDRKPLTLPLKSPRIVIHKTERKLELFSDKELLRTYKIGLGFNPVADKVREGDGATPEGEFYIFVKNNKSAYYLSLGISYPNAEDAERGLRDNLITRAEYNAIVNAIKKRTAPPQYTKLGGLIYIHGNGAQKDWTWGCVALENDDIKELYDAVVVGTRVTISH